MAPQGIGDHFVNELGKLEEIPKLVPEEIPVGTASKILSWLGKWNLVLAVITLPFTESGDQPPAVVIQAQMKELEGIRERWNKKLTPLVVAPFIPASASPEEEFEIWQRWWREHPLASSAKPDRTSVSQTLRNSAEGESKANEGAEPSPQAQLEPSQPSSNEAGPQRPLRLGLIYNQMLKPNTDPIIQFAKTAKDFNFELLPAWSVDDFLKRYPNPKDYDGILLHPSQEEWSHTVQHLREYFQGTRYAFIERRPVHDEDNPEPLGPKVEHGLTFFRLEDINGIREFFTQPKTTDKSTQEIQSDQNIAQIIPESVSEGSWIELRYQEGAPRNNIQGKFIKEDHLFITLELPSGTQKEFPKEGLDLSKTQFLMEPLHPGEQVFIPRPTGVILAPVDHVDDKGRVWFKVQNIVGETLEVHFTEQQLVDWQFRYSLSFETDPEWSAGGKLESKRLN